MPAALNVFWCFSLVFVGFLVSAGCRSTSGVQDDAAGDVPADSSMAYTNAIHVLVDGNDKGIIPMTLRIRRSFGTRRVSLWQSGEEFRFYEIEMSRTVEGDQTIQGFWSTRSMQGDSYDVRNLPMDGDDTFLIPYTPHPIKVEDHAYGVTLLVQE